MPVFPLFRIIASHSTVPTPAFPTTVITLLEAAFTPADCTPVTPEVYAAGHLSTEEAVNPVASGRICCLVIIHSEPVTPVNAYLKSGVELVVNISLPRIV